jgi:hypothetical protein
MLLPSSWLIVRTICDSCSGGKAPTMSILPITSVSVPPGAVNKSVVAPMRIWSPVANSWR